MRNISKIIAAAAFAAAAIPAAFADSGSTWVGGEAGFASHPAQSGLTREQVRAELAQFVRDGGSLASGELDFKQPHQHAYADRDGRRVHDDSAATMGNSAASFTAPAAPAAALSWTERQDLIGGPN